MLGGQDHPLGSNIHGFPVNDPIIYLVTLCSDHLHATALHGFRAAKSGEETCMTLYDISNVQFKNNTNEYTSKTETNSGLGASLVAH